MFIANVEGDELVMQVVTSLTKRDYLIKLNSGSTIKNHRRSDKRKLIKKMEKIGKLEGRDYTLELEFSYGKFDTAVFLIERKLKKIKYMTNADYLQLWLGPDDGSNFRFKSAKTQAYKSNRAEKPELVKLLREYLCQTHSAQIIYGYEADDALGIYQNMDTIAVHCDKDIFMVPGLHLDTLKNEILYVIDDRKNGWMGMVFQKAYIDQTTHVKFPELFLVNNKLKGYGYAFFYAQLLIGDSTDTIPPMIKGFGPTKAYNALSDCQYEEEYLWKVISLYKNNHNDWYTRLLEQADLVWICRNKEETGADYIANKIEQYNFY